MVSGVREEQKCLQSLSEPGGSVSVCLTASVLTRRCWGYNEQDGRGEGGEGGAEG